MIAVHFLSFLVLSCSIINPPSELEKTKKFKILTLNLLFDEPTTKDDRFEKIAKFIQDEKFDCVVIQEAVGGTLATARGLTETINSALDLYWKLPDYQFRYRWANGIPLVFSIGIGMYFKQEIEIIDTWGMDLPFTSEVTIDFLG